MTRIACAALIALAAVAAVVAAIVTAPAAAAHPLNNFSVNHYTRITISDTGIEVYRVLDLAETPALLEIREIDANDNDVVDPAEGEAYAQSKADELAQGMLLRIDGDRADLTRTQHNLTTPPGDGGLLLLRLEVAYAVALPEGWDADAPSVEYEDRNYGGRLGWREVVVRAGQGVEIVDSDLPMETISGELLAYPEDSLSSPPDVRKATFGFRPGAGVAPSAESDRHERAVRGNPDSALDRFENLIAKDLSVGVIAVALLSATAFGAIHALSPGHGKTIVGAYLVGSRGTWRHALLLGLTVTATHTSSVYLLGFVTLYFSEYVLPEDLYPWLGVGSGGIIVVMGLALFVGRVRSAGLHRELFDLLRSRFRRAFSGTGPALNPQQGEGVVVLRPAHAAAMHARASGAAHEHAVRATSEHSHEHDQGHGHAGDAGHHHDDDGAGGHDHPSDAPAHRHGFGPAHSHAIPGQDGEPVTWQRLVGLGIFGGMIPCPSAIIVMLSAISLHRVGFGLVLIVFFSLGLAAVLTGIGFALVYAGAISRRLPWLRRAIERVDASEGLTGLAVRATPAAAAAFVVVVGSLVALNALRDV